MKRISFLLLSVLLLFCAGCGEVPVPAPSVETNEPVEEPPIFLELHFGNGEVLKKEIQSLIIPYYSAAMDNYFNLIYTSSFDGEGLFSVKMIDYFTSKRAPYTTAVFPDGNMYSMSEIRSTDVDIDSRTLIAYLWRDEPYQTEREYFEAIEKKED